MAKVKNTEIAIKTNKTVYALVLRIDDNFVLDGTDGKFKVLGDLGVIEDAAVIMPSGVILPDLKLFKEDRSVWKNGEHLFIYYEQQGGGISIGSDTILFSERNNIVFDIVDNFNNQRLDLIFLALFAGASSQLTELTKQVQSTRTATLDAFQELRNASVFGARQFIKQRENLEGFFTNRGGRKDGRK